MSQLALTWKKHALQQRGRPGGRGLLVLLVPPLSSSRAWSRASSRSTILTADTNGVGFCRARARALLTTAQSSLPTGTRWMLRMLETHPGTGLFVIKAADIHSTLFSLLLSTLHIKYSVMLLSLRILGFQTLTLKC